VGGQDYDWQRLTTLAAAPWTCVELPEHDGTARVGSADGGEDAPAKVDAAALRKAMLAVLAAADYREAVQVLEQRAHLVDTGEDDAIVPWHDKLLDQRMHQVAFWLIHVGARLAERNASDANKGLRAGGRLLRLVFADRRIRTAVDRAELLTGALALAAAGEVVEAAESVTGLRSSAPIDAALIALLCGEMAVAGRAAQGVSIRMGRATLHAVMAETLAPIIKACDRHSYDDIAQSCEQLSAIRERAADEEDPWVWWRARLLRITARSMARRSPIASLSGALSEDRTVRLSRAIARIGVGALPLLNDAARTAVAASVGRGARMIVSDDPRTTWLCAASSIVATAERGSTWVRVADAASGRALASRIAQLGNATSDLRVDLVGGDESVLRKGAISIGTAVDLVSARARSIEDDGQLEQPTGLICLDLPAGVEDPTLREEVALEALVAVADAAKADRVLVVARNDRNAAVAKWWKRAKKPDATVRRGLPLRRGVLFVTDARVRIAWRDAIGSLQPSWFQTVELADKSRTFPVGRNEAVAAAATRYARLGPTVVVCAAPKALAEVVQGAVTAAQLREGVLRPHRWPHDEWQRFDRAARDAGLSDERVRATRAGFASWSRTDAPPVRDAMERLLASTAARVAIVDLDLPAIRLAPYAHVLFTAATADGLRLDPAAVARYAHHAGVPGVDRQGQLLIAVDGRRAREQVVRDVGETDALLAGLTSVPASGGLLHAADVLASTSKAKAAVANRTYTAELLANSPGAALVDAKHTLAAAESGKPRSKLTKNRLKALAKALASST